MPERANELVQKTTASLNDLRTPVALRRSIEQHQDNLLSLAKALLVAGKSEQEILEILDSAFSSYKKELTKTIVTLGNEQ
ncbi:hypothetical protein [Kiloniella sp. b19]|uniref:hypothetical protein n=1 Tax=Kiloniella sp. GXU_MW_B19 TaxID=3141326 RepID=UPI0031D44387